MTETNVRSAGSLGGQMKALRDARGCSIVDLAMRTRVPAAKIEAIEAERWADLPAPPYVRGFIRSMAAALGLGREAAERLVESYRRRVPQAGTPAQLPSLTKSDILVPILVRDDGQSRGRAALGIALLALAGLAIPIVAFLIS